MEIVKKERLYGSRFLVALLPWGLLFFIYCFFGPLSLIHANSVSFSFDTPDATPAYLLLFVALTAVFSGLSALTRPPVYDAILRLVLSVSVASYIQGNFLNPDFGIMDGRFIDWSEYAVPTLINLGIWGAIFFALYLISVYLAAHWKKILCILSALLLVMQTFALIPSYFTPTDENAAEAYTFSMEELLTVSESKNVIIFCLDAMSNSAVRDTFDTYPETREIFRDFTYFTNCAPTFWGTYPEVLSMLTGNNAYDTNASHQDFEYASWNSEKADRFYALLRENGYSANLFHPKSRYITGKYSNVSGKIANAVPTLGEDAPEVSLDIPLMLESLAEFTCFVYAPLGLKAVFQPDTEAFAQIILSDDSVDYCSSAAFASRFAEEGITTASGGRFLYYHLWGAHPPYLTDENCLPVAQADGTREDQLCGCFRIIEKYMAGLKTAGVYDDAMIIVTADHGDSGGSDPSFDPSAAFFIKNPGQTHGAYETNAAPITHMELLPTIAEAVQPGSGAALGQTVYDIPEGADRERSLYAWYNDQSSAPIGIYNCFLRTRFTCDINELPGLSLPNEKLMLFDSFY